GERLRHGAGRVKGQGAGRTQVDGLVDGQRTAANGGVEVIRRDAVGREDGADRQRVRTVVEDDGPGGAGGEGAGAVTVEEAERAAPLQPQLAGGAGIDDRAGPFRSTGRVQVNR